MILSAHPSPQPKRHLDRFSCFFAQMTAECPYTLRDDPSPLKIAPSHGGLGLPSNTWFPGPPEFSAQMASRSVQPFLQSSLVWQTDRLWLTDHATRSVTIGRVYVHSTAMWPNNYWLMLQIKAADVFEVWVSWRVHVTTCCMNCRNSQTRRQQIVMFVFFCSFFICINTTGREMV